MREIIILDAYREALNSAMRDPDVFIIGEDVGIGSTFGLYTGMIERYGKDRIINTPISEIALSGCAIGAAMSGMRPIIDFQFADFIFCAMDQLANQASKMYYLSDGRTSVPVTVCLPVGANRRGAQHAQCVESYFMNVPGLKIVAPSTPYEAKGLMLSAVKDNNPVLVCQHKLLYSVGKNVAYDWMRENVPEEAYEIPLGKARIRREGRDVTIVASMLMLYRAMEAADILGKRGISAEVIDPRTIKPIDSETITASVKKTGKLLIVEESPTFGGWGNEIVAEVTERMDQGCKVRRLGCTENPMPYAQILENMVIPQTEQIVNMAVAMQ